MLWQFIVSGGTIPPLKFTDEPRSTDRLEGKCFLDGGTMRCRNCLHSGLCDLQDGYESERERGYP